MATELTAQDSYEDIRVCKNLLWVIVIVTIIIPLILFICGGLWVQQSQERMCAGMVERLAATQDPRRAGGRWF